jgi:hypothetical protein
LYQKLIVSSSFGATKADELVEKLLSDVDSSYEASLDIEFTGEPSVKSQADLSLDFDIALDAKTKDVVNIPIIKITKDTSSNENANLDLFFFICVIILIFYKDSLTIRNFYLTIHQ